MKAKKLSELLKESLEKQQNQPKRLKSSKMIENNEAERFERRKQDFKNKKNISDKLALVEKNLTEKENSTTNIKSYSIDNLKIIGITGSFGKTSTAVLIHRYLQAIGKKSVLYSSAYIDSPATWIGRQNSYTSVIKTQDEFLNMVEECLVYKADYLIVECWEDSIARGVFDNIKFRSKSVYMHRWRSIHLCRSQLLYTSRCNQSGTGLRRRACQAGQGRGPYPWSLSPPDPYSLQQFSAAMASASWFSNLLWFFGCMPWVWYQASCFFTSRITSSQRSSLSWPIWACS